ncbi:MAG: response regulator [Ignavibacteria bacterium]|nr:response regulator [Ignavibacteria bacterium]
MTTDPLTRLLYVDDDASIRFVVKDQLTPEGFDIHTADDGVEAMEMLTHNTYDIVLLDIQMPRKDGLEVLKFMREKNLRPRVIMLTAVEDINIAIQAVKLGANDYITKPFTLETLLAGIRRILAR